MDKINIAYIVSSLGVSGPTTQLYNLIRYLDRNTFNVNLVTLSSETKNSEWSSFEKLGIPLHSVYLNRVLGMFFSKYRLKIILSKLKPDLIHTQGLRADLLCSQLEQIHCRFSTQRNWPLEDYPMLYGPIFGAILSRLHLRGLKNIPNVIACSKDIARRQQSIGLNADVVENGVDLSLGQSITSNRDKRVARIELGLPQNGNIFVTAGPFIKRKSLKYLINTFSKLGHSGSTHLCLLGDGPMMRECRRIAKNQPNIFFRGWVKDISPYLVAGDAYISASRSEGLPNAVLEALSWGLPVYLSDIPSHQDILVNHPDAGHLFSLQEPEKLLNLLKIFSPSISASEAARQIVTTHLNASRMSFEYQRRYLASFTQSA